MIGQKHRPIPLGVYAAEFAGTGLLVMVGLSFVILNFSNNSPVVQAIPNSGVRRAITGFLFGSTGAMVAISPLGKESGAHINPVVTLSFWLMGKLRTNHAFGYIMSQLSGAALGCLPLLAWGSLGQSVMYGATVPGEGYSAGEALLGEIVTTFLLVAGLFFFLTRHSIRSFTPALFPFLYAVMVFLEAPISGTSTNPARSLGPAIISGQWKDWWIYWLGPSIGAILGVMLYSQKWWTTLKIETAKLYHFEHDRYGIFKD